LDRLHLKSFLYRLLRRVPMPVLAILVGLLAGLGVWGVLEQVQGRALQKITQKELRSELDLRARESLSRFNQYVSNYESRVRLLASHRLLARHLTPQFWFAEERVEPRIYQQFRPDWLPDSRGQDALPGASHVLLVDTEGRIREVYHLGEEPLPVELAAGVPAQYLDPRAVRAVLTRLGDRPLLVVSDLTEDGRGFEMGSLVVLVPIDERFLAASQEGQFFERAPVALVDGDDQRILASVDPDLILPGTLVDVWKDDHLVTLQSLPGYEGTDWNVLFATFVSHDNVEKIARRVGHFERRQRVIAAVVFITVFTMVIYLVSARLNRVLKRMSRFAQRALDIEQPEFRAGANQLVLLEEWSQHFTQLVLRARDEMRRQHESAIRQSEALKAAIMEASLDSIVTLDRKGQIIDLNPAAEQILGGAREQVLGRGFSELFLPPGERERFDELLQAARRARVTGREPPARAELSARRSDGREIPMELSIVPLSLEAQVFYTLYLHDVTKRREAEREIKSLARIASESPNPILRVTPTGQVVYANAASGALLVAWGTRPGLDLPPEWAGEVGETLAAGQAREREAEVGGQVYSFLLAPVAELGYVNIYARDITEVRRAEQQSRQHQAELVHVCRLSTMGEVATGMAHEINQPLSAIVNYANGCTRRLQGGAGDSGALIEAMGQIATQAQRASEIIRRLRALVGKQPPVRNRVDLNHLVREVCSFVEFETSRMGLEVALDLATGELPVDVDLVQIEQVLLNLVRNALDALGDVAPESRRLVIRTRSTAGEAEVVVEDSGPGIAPARLPHLFDPFFTTKETGMGMGLPISQTILENHGGRVWAESPPAGGAVFHVRLPLAVEVTQFAVAGAA
jgi:PAS domain S-box-containing protein